jgi:hypothetical protein
MPPRPAIRDIVRLSWSLRRGSRVDARQSFLAAVRELKEDTPPGSPLTRDELLAREDYTDLRTPKLRPGDPAFDFDLPRQDAAGARVRLSAFREVQPVALIFGSYT